jgi:hypothetical protein
MASIYKIKCPNNTAHQSKLKPQEDITSYMLEWLLSKDKHVEKEYLYTHGDNKS